MARQNLTFNSLDEVQDRLNLLLDGGYEKTGSWCLLSRHRMSAAEIARRKNATCRSARGSQTPTAPQAPLGKLIKRINLQIEHIIRQETNADGDSEPLTPQQIRTYQSRVYPFFYFPTSRIPNSA